MKPNSVLAIILQLPIQFNSSTPKLITRQTGVSKLDSPLYAAQMNSSLQPLCTEHAENTTSLLLGRRVYMLLAYSFRQECVYRVVA
jgi:hypothetical protein